jgi:lysophospholipase L1-like esterase
LNRLLPIIVAAVLVAPVACVQAVDERAIHERSLVSMGDLSRIQHALAKARRGEAVGVAVIGGSITAGALASAPAKRWGNMVAEWWRRTFPEATISFVNAGIGATGSNLGAHRAQRHLLVHEPDFVVAEYGVNDGNAEIFAETLEGLTRQTLSMRNQPGMMLLFMTTKVGGNAQEWHGKIGRHYGLPMVSFRDALWPEIEAGRIAWEDVAADEIHPNDRGHRYCADFVTRVLDGVLAALPPDEALPAIPSLPQPLISDVFQHVEFLPAGDLEPSVNEGWELFDSSFGRGWEANEPGSIIEFDVKGTALSLSYFRIKGDMGMAKVSVDGEEVARVDGWFDADWGGYTEFLLAKRDLPPGAHTIRVEVLSDKAEASGAHEFQVWAVMTAGMTPD